MLSFMNFLTKIFSKNKKIKIDFCEKNLDRFLTDESASHYRSFFSEKHIAYKEYECQSKCKECAKSPYALVDSEFISAENSDQLLEKLKQKVQNCTRKDV